MNRILLLLSNFLLFSVLASFILGIGLSYHLDISLKLLVWLALSCCLLLVICFFYRLTRTVQLTLLPTFFLIGLSYGSFSNLPPENPSHVYNLIEDRREVVLVGTLAAMVSSDGTDSKAQINLESLRFSEDTLFQPAFGSILLRIKGPWPSDILPGMKMAIRADLHRPTGFNTPGSFDYPAHLARQGIWITGFIRTQAFLHTIENSPSLFDTLRFYPEKLRHLIGITIDQAVLPHLQGVYRALLIGDQTRVDDKIRDAFRDSGCMHILSISGLHFAIIGALLFLIFYWLLRRSEWLILHYDVKKIALLGCLPPLCFYALLAGTNAPVLRSLIMSCIAIFALCVDRRKSIPTLLVFAAILILLENPQSLFNISFQLSFLAIAAISAATPVLSHFIVGNDNKKTSQFSFLRLKKWFFSALSVSVAATLGTAPLLLASFNQISLVGPVANLIVEPLICLWSLPLALLSCLAMPFSLDTAIQLMRLGTPGLELSLWVMELCNTLPFSSVRLATPHPLLILCYYCFLGSFLWSLYRMRRIPSQMIVFFIPVLFLFIVTPAELTKKLKRDMTVTFLDVGQGSSTLIEYPGGYRILIDGGGSISSARQIGESVIAPFLWQKGITSIDHIIITHPDADHYNGIPFILKHFKPSLLWTNNLVGHDRPYLECIEEAKRLDVQIILPKNNENLAVQERTAIRCVANLEQKGVQGNSVGGQRSNDSGLILQSTYNDFAVLFPGDISTSAETDLCKKRNDIESSLLLAAHHGSKTSNSQNFLSAVNPRFLIVSAGNSRPGIFPRPGLLEQCRQHGISMLTTARNGTIKVTTDGKHFSVIQYRRDKTSPLPSRFVADMLAENVPARPISFAAR